MHFYEGHAMQESRFSHSKNNIRVVEKNISEPNRWKLSLLALLLTGLFVIGRNLPAQTASGTITGRVSDPSGAVVSGASVMLKQVDTNLMLHAVTNSDGLSTTSPPCKPATLK